MARLGITTALLILTLVAVFGNGSVSRDQCTPTRYCPDGYLCCPDTLHCCAIGYRCCFSSTRCCLHLSLNSTVASESGESTENYGNSGNGDVVVQVDQRDYQRILQRVFPRVHAGMRGEEIMDRPLDNNPVVIVYN
uniref:Cysteine rich secreted protein n=1 Tax=Lygus hesperus TaxID=30085 RepID=A0A146L6X2_LYGHE